MLALIAILASAAAAGSPPSGSDPPPMADLQHAIWYDLFRNAMIGNGNELASLWYNAGAQQPASPDLHMTGLDCRAAKRAYRCTFTLLRDGGPRVILQQVAPDKLSCAADLVLEKDDGEVRWEVRHSPPLPTGGHSRTSIRCTRP